MIWKNILYASLFILHLSCEKETKLIGVNHDFVLGNCAVVEKVEMISKTGTTLRFKVNGIKMIDSYTFGDYHQGSGGYSVVEFDDGVDWTYILDSVNYTYPSSFENYSACLLFDKTFTDFNGDKYGDPFNYFLKESTSNGNEIMLGGISRTDNETPLTDYSNGFFNSYGDEQKDALYSLISTKQEGTFSLLDAVDKALEITNNHSTSNKKHIVVFFGGDDDELGKDYLQIIQKSISYNIPISFIRFDWAKGYIWDNQVISQQTNGYFSAPGSTAGFYTAIYSLNKILSKNYVTMNFYMRFISTWVNNTDDWPGFITIDYSHTFPFTMYF